MHVAGRKKMKSGYEPAQNRMVHHGGSFERFPAMAWADCDGRHFAITAEEFPGLEPFQLQQKCEAMFRNGCGWKVEG
jgi:hypothetical protein